MHIPLLRKQSAGNAQERFCSRMLFLTDAKFMTDEFIFCKIQSIKAKYGRQQHFTFQPTSFKSITSGNHTLSTYAEFSEKLKFITP